GLTEGQHSVEIRAIDLAGKVASSPATWSWVVDTIAPTVIDLTGPTGVVISGGVFFPRRVREALHHDAEIVLNPTNGSSYWLTQVQSQQIASSALRAVESGRWVIQAAPTGFSAIIDPDGVVQQRSGVSEARVLEQTVELRRGRTLAMWWGEAPALLASLIALAWAWAWAWARSMSRSTQRRVVAVDSDTGPCADND
ncbi:MAG TPA: nitrilase-related carbon-nitrogen hydrolase, partial [Microthrixaceae bacterium]|nr:nitrilase-related carbon-nitrogen hydrolase [Microthrixaceae bacterium]